MYDCVRLRSMRDWNLQLCFPTTRKSINGGVADEIWKVKDGERDSLQISFDRLTSKINFKMITLMDT
jgi:hypothetical protein